MNVFRLVGMVSKLAYWFTRATADGRVTVDELAQLAAIVAEGIGVKTHFTIGMRKRPPEAENDALAVVTTEFGEKPEELAHLVGKNLTEGSTV